MKKYKRLIKLISILIIIYLLASYYIYTKTPYDYYQKQAHKKEFIERFKEGDFSYIKRTTDKSDPFWKIFFENYHNDFSFLQKSNETLSHKKDDPMLFGTLISKDSDCLSTISFYINSVKKNRFGFPIMVLSNTSEFHLKPQNFIVDNIEFNANIEKFDKELKITFKDLKYTISITKDTDTLNFSKFLKINKSSAVIEGLDDSEYSLDIKSWDLDFKFKNKLLKDSKLTINFKDSMAHYINPFDPTSIAPIYFENILQESNEDIKISGNLINNTGKELFIYTKNKDNKIIRAKEKISGKIIFNTLFFISKEPFIKYDLNKKINLYLTDSYAKILSEEKVKNLYDFYNKLWGLELKTDLMIFPFLSSSARKDLMNLEPFEDFEGNSYSHYVNKKEQAYELLFYHEFAHFFQQTRPSLERIVTEGLAEFSAFLAYKELNGVDLFGKLPSKIKKEPDCPYSNGAKLFYDIYLKDPDFLKKITKEKNILSLKDF